MLEWSDLDCRRLLALLSLIWAGANAEVPSFPKGFETLPATDQGALIFTEKDRLDSGYRDLQVNLQMVLRDRRGNESRRELRISQLEMEDDGDRLLVVFDTPKAIRGTALLSYSHKLTPDDQWLYLPAHARVKKIASRNKSGPFLSSEFAYEDMALQEVEKLLDEAALRVQRIEYFDRARRPLKVLTVDDYVLHDDQFWKAARMNMENLQTGKSTELQWRDYRFATGLSADRDFSTNSLFRAR